MCGTSWNLSHWFSIFCWSFLFAPHSFPGGASGKEPTCQCRRPKRRGFYPWTGKIPWRRKWQPTPVFLPGESHGQRSLTGCSPWGCKKLDTTERIAHSLCVFLCTSSNFLNWTPDSLILAFFSIFNICLRQFIFSPSMPQLHSSPSET